MNPTTPNKKVRHNQILSELLLIAIRLKVEYADYQHATITPKEYELVATIRLLIDEFEELDIEP